jgi:hypothetical protein
MYTKLMFSLCDFFSIGIFVHSAVLMEDRGERVVMSNYNNNRRWCSLTNSRESGEVSSGINNYSEFNIASAAYM